MNEHPPTMAELYEAMRIVDAIGQIAQRIASRLNLMCEIDTLRTWNIEQAIMHRLYDDSMHSPVLSEAVPDA